MATLSDVARLAGVSLSTASRALNGSRDRVVRQDLAEKALAAAEALHYVPNGAAQAMARGHSTTMALIVNEIRDPYFSSIAAGVMRAADKAGYFVSMSSIAYDHEALIPLINALRQQRPEALILAGSLYNDPAYLRQVIARLAEFQLSTEAQICSIGQDGLGWHSVNARNRAGARGLGLGLIERGFTRAAVLAGDDFHLASRKRSEGFVAGFETGGDITAHVTSDVTREGGYQAMKTVLSVDARPQVVFAANDVMAIGALAAVREAGLTVPDNIGLAGFDDIPGLVDVVPSLTTVRAPMELLGATAVNLVLQPSGAEPTAVRLSTTPVFRDSTSVVPA
ncbi:MAG: LacI family transcriptional regulator [Propionibacteriaceae bacterium]|jgi:LacI family transcriptional regulator|nr:LacI family transcriptional regulator [Propionibacteriaceae bacterium]